MVDFGYTTTENLGEREDISAIERTAMRIQGVLSTIDQNLPPELLEGE